MAVTETERSVEAEFTYLVYTGAKPVTYVNMPEDERKDPGSYEIRTHRVTDARPLIGTLDLDREGFVLVPHETALTDFYDPDRIETVYRAELERLVVEVTGARRAHVFDFTLRAEADDIQEARKVRSPVKRVHNDYTERSGPRRVRDLLPDEADALLERRFAIVNVWRPMFGPLLSRPLALLDARSIAPGDLVATERRARDRIGEIQHVTYNPAHRWYYFPGQERDEAILVKTYDSATDGRTRFAAHSAFEDPTTPPDARPRESIEARVFAFF